MNVDRRSLMKGLLAGGALLAMGTPPWTFAESPVRRPGRCLLVLGGTGADEAFASGAGAACAGLTDDALRIVKLKGGLFTDMDRMVTLLDQSRGTRMIAVMDDAGAVIFLELARTAGVRLLSMGTHVCSADSACPLRHAWATTSPTHGVGGILAAELAAGRDGFSMTEDFLHAPGETDALSGWSAPGFSSYRSTESDSVHLHSSGLALAEGRRVIGLTAIEGWEPIPLQACRRETVRRQSGDWIESVGYAATVSALGVDSVRESCASRAFVRPSPTGERTHSQERFVSFVMDI
ncbi:MAG: hypothetical protein IT391_10980 [Nitrospira sp.]|nr:hypothetical protein [Nitrospira sp.]